MKKLEIETMESLEAGGLWGCYGAVTVVAGGIVAGAIVASGGTAAAGALGAIPFLQSVAYGICGAAAA